MSRKVSRRIRTASQMSRIMARETAFKALFQLDFNFAAEDEDDTAYEDLAIETMIEDARFLTGADNPQELTENNNPQELTGNDNPQKLTENDDPRKLTEDDLLYVEATVKGTRAHLEEIDEIISAHLKRGWQLSRIVATDRNILRLAVYEMRFVESPLSKNIVINEAVELAKKYGTDDSGRFVNGILEAISK